MTTATTTETIRCPECLHEQEVTVEHTHLWPIYVHVCHKCWYVIMESEWEKVSEHVESYGKANQI